MKKLSTALFALLAINSMAQNSSNYVKQNYTKIDTTITMRDGIKLYTVIFVPKDASQQYPFLLDRTPYSAGPYGADNYPNSIGPNSLLMKEKYIFVKQDVRGRYMSEGINLEVTPYIANKKTSRDVDESSDTYDTIDWLLKNVQNNNGRAGIAGISYPWWRRFSFKLELLPTLERYDCAQQQYCLEHTHGWCSKCNHP